jgi:polar amino acid transport system substrate-binding protein
MRRRQLSYALPAFAIASSAWAESSMESTFERIRRTRIVRVGAVGGDAPYSVRDLASGEWRGFVPAFGRDLAKAMDAEAVFLESNPGNAVLDLQAGKVDIFFALNPTPQRALAIDFTHPLFNNLFTLVARPGFGGRTWDDLNDPSVRIAVELGSSYDEVISEICPRASVLRLVPVRSDGAKIQLPDTQCG